ncbi:MAG: hypothetical protein U0Q16_30580 [Bryobacteraceae bacterium]
MAFPIAPKLEWVRADFNGLFGDVLCLSHSDRCIDYSGQEVEFRTGMIVTAFEEDGDDGEPDCLVATGVVEPSPEWLSCRGSCWVLLIDENGVRSESEIA